MAEPAHCWKHPPRRPSAFSCHISYWCILLQTGQGTGTTIHSMCNLESSVSLFLDFSRFSCHPRSSRPCSFRPSTRTPSGDTLSVSWSRLLSTNGKRNSRFCFRSYTTRERLQSVEVCEKTLQVSQNTYKIEPLVCSEEHPSLYIEL